MAAPSRAVKIYRVGGSVRDELLGRPVVDRDWVVVGATPEILIASGYKPVGRDFPVFLHRDTGEEYALARTERKHGRGYRGFEFFASPDVTLAEDLARRDLTINAMARDERGELIDPYGGQADLAAGVLRHVSPAFVEDPLRVLRVARFAARFGFAVAPETRRLMRELVATGELAELASERVWQELAKGLLEPHPARMLSVLHDCGALVQLMPEVDALYATGSRARRSKASPGARLSRRWSTRRNEDSRCRSGMPFSRTTSMIRQRWHAVGRLARRRCATCGAPRRCPPGSRCRWNVAMPRASRRDGIGSSFGRPRCSRRSCSTSSTPPTHCAARSGSRRCCTPASAS